MLNVVMDRDMIRIGERFAVSFQRTLRVPDDGNVYPLPPGLGRFPVISAKNYFPLTPDDSEALIPMYRSEALWLAFGAAAWKPNAVQVAVGGVNAITGEDFNSGLCDNPQNYIVCPNQPWLDGVHAGRGFIRQFVAVLLGEGYSVEASITGAEERGGIQITVFEPKPGVFPEEPPPAAKATSSRLAAPVRAREMGIGAGGAIRQKIYPDPYGVDTWDRENYGRVSIRLVSSLEFLKITGMKPPPTPIDAKTYSDLGLPWFDLYDESEGALSDCFAEIKTISQREAELGETGDAADSLDVARLKIKKIRGKRR